MGRSSKIPGKGLRSRALRSRMQTQILQDYDETNGFLILRCSVSTLGMWEAPSFTMFYRTCITCHSYDLTKWVAFISWVEFCGFGSCVIHGDHIFATSLYEVEVCDRYRCSTSMPNRIG